MQARVEGNHRRVSGREGHADQRCADNFGRHNAGCLQAGYRTRFKMFKV
jgi:hypothetical protein